MIFEKIAQDPQSSARCGLLYTDHGVIETPIFMPVGTVGSVKGVYHKDLKEDIKAQYLFRNYFADVCSPDYTWKHLSSLFETGSPDNQSGRWSAQVHLLGQTYAHRQRRLPGFLLS